MPHSPSPEPMDVDAVDARMAGWRQGDALLDADLTFVSQAHAATPLSAAARSVAETDPPEGAVLDVVTDEIGFVVTSQTCDIIRSSATRHHVELSPLVELDAQSYAEAKRGSRPRYAPVPALAPRRLVADLDRVMVVEKALLAAYPAEAQVAGCADDAERASFAAALARKYARFAFPDDFNAGLKPVASHIVAKCGKQSPLGRFLDAVDDIRAECRDWDASDPEVTLLFIFPEQGAAPSDAGTHIKALLDRFAPTGAFKRPSGQVASLDTMTAARLRRSHPLDLDHLSGS